MYDLAIWVMKNSRAGLNTRNIFPLRVLNYSWDILGTCANAIGHT